MSTHIRLTDAQVDIVKRHNITGTLTGKTLTVDSLEQLLEELAPLVAQAMATTYSAETSRDIFATRYLATKVEKLVANPPAAEPTALEVDNIVPDLEVTHVDEPGSQYRVIKTNLDGSVQVYGGDGSYRMFRDFPVDKLRQPQPKRVPPRDR